MENNLYENAKYIVALTDNALNEEGKYGVPGYAVINIKTGVVEHTTMVLPQALFQADAFMGGLQQLEDGPKEVEDDFIEAPVLQ